MKNQDWIGKDVVIRNSSAGVLFGRVKAKTRESTTLELGGRLHSWSGGALCVEQVASSGVKGAKKASFALQTIRTIAGEQIILATQDAMINLRGLADWKG
jgi:hypothetical protein